MMFSYDMMFLSDLLVMGVIVVLILELPVEQKADECCSSG